MFDDVDIALTNLLAAEEPFIKTGQVDVSFEQPRREWSQRLLRPTINFYLCDVNENARLRPNTQPVELARSANGRSRTRRAPVRVDLHYLVTAWAATPADEHRLLARIMRALLKNMHFDWEHLPAAWIEQWQDEDIPVTLTVAQDEPSAKPAELWGVLGNDMRPSVRCVVTAPLRLDDAVREEVLVRELEMRFQPESSPVGKSRAKRTAAGKGAPPENPAEPLDPSRPEGPDKPPRGSPAIPRKDESPDVKLHAAVSLISVKPMLDLKVVLVEWNEEVKSIRWREPLQSGVLRDPVAWEAARWREADLMLFNLKPGSTYHLTISSTNHPARNCEIRMPATATKPSAKDALVIRLD